MDAVRHWLQRDIKRKIFDRVIFSSKANSSLVEGLMHTSFPLYPLATRDSGSSFTDVQRNGDENESMKNGTETKPLQNGTEFEHKTDVLPNRTELLEQNAGPLEEDRQNENGIDTVEDKDESSRRQEELSTEDLLESLQALQDENMKTVQELMGQLGEMTPEPSPDRLKIDSSDFFSRSLPSHYQDGDFLFQGARSVSPSSKLSHRRCKSGDLILNPDRTESDV